MQQVGSTGPVLLVVRWFLITKKTMTSQTAKRPDTENQAIEVEQGKGIGADVSPSAFHAAPEENQHDRKHGKHVFQAALQPVNQAHPGGFAVKAGRIVPSVVLFGLQFIAIGESPTDPVLKIHRQ